MEVIIKRYLSQTFLTKQEAAQAFLEELLSHIFSRNGMIYFLDDTSKHFTLRVWSKSILANSEHSVSKCRDNPAEGPWQKAINTQQATILTPKEIDIHRQFIPHPVDNIKQYIYLPLLADNKVFAVIGASIIEHNDAQRIHELAIILRQYEECLKQKFDTAEEHYSQLKNDFLSLTSDTVLVEMLMAISNALELRDAYTTHHQRNVSYISELIATELNLNPERIFGLRVGALIHDLGKIVIPSQLLNKSGKLEHAEYDYLKLHAEKGAYILKDAHFPWPIQKMIAQHHERLDGSGYPEGLKENEIILEAKIIAVADTFDAMAHDRPYRSRPGLKKTLETLQDGRMTKYDPYVLDAFMNCFSRDNTFGGRYELD